MASSTPSAVNSSGLIQPRQHHSNAGTITSAAGMSAVMLLAIVGNVLIIVIFRVFSRVRKQVTNHFLVNLAISDLIVALVTMPFWLMWEIDRWGSMRIDLITLHHMWTFLDITCEASSIANLAVVSVDRLYSVSNPFKHHTTVTPSLAHKIIFGAWGYALAVASVYLIDFQWKTLVITIFGFIIPLAIMIVCYIKIVFVVRAFRCRWHSNPHTNRQFFGCIVNEYKTAKSLGVVMVAFVICWTPFFVSSLMVHYCESCAPFLLSKPVIPAVTKWLHYLNSALNPILYTFFNPSYRVVFRRFYAWCMRKENYRCTSYEAWYLGSRRVSTHSQRSGSLARLNGARMSYTSSIHRPSTGSIIPTKTESAENPGKDDDQLDDSVFVDEGNTNEVAVPTEQNGGPGDKLRPPKNSTSKNRVSFCDTIL